MQSDQFVIIVIFSIFVMSDANSNTTTINLVISLDNKAIKPAINAACSYFKETYPNTDVMCDIQDFYTTHYNLEEQACSKIKSLSQDTNVDAIIDFAIDVRQPHEPVKRALQKLSVNKIYVMYGTPQDHSALNMYNNEYIQIQPPGHSIGDMIINLAKKLEITAAAVLYDETIDMNYRYRNLLPNLPIRHIIMRISNQGNQNQEIQNQLKHLRSVDLTAFFVTASMNTIKAVLSAAANLNMFNRMFLWVVITKDDFELRLPCENCFVIFAKPILPVPAGPEKIKKYGLPDSQIESAFSFDAIFLTLSTILKMKTDVNWKQERHTVLDCDSSTTVTLNTTNFRNQLKKEQKNYQGIFGKFAVNSDQTMSMMFSMGLHKFNTTAKDDQTSQMIGEWKSGKQLGSNGFYPTFNIKDITVKAVYQIATTVKPPFVYKIKNENGSFTYDGYCIDMLKAVQTALNFQYDIYDVPEISNVSKTPDNWPGIITEIVERRAHIGLGPLFVISDQEKVVDFTIPFYDLVGMKILMKKPIAETSLFKFLTVMEPTVWASILCAYLLTSLLLWLIDTYSPFSYQNNKLKFKDDPEKREFNLKESLWFCITSLTPQGGGEAPKNMSGRLIAATWWLFSFIVIASYTANLAAFLTVSRLDSAIDSLEGLASQFKIQYAPVNNSGAMNYFSRMASIEEKFFEKWNEMTMKEDMTEEERLQYTVYDYPVGDKYTKIWQAMVETGFPQTLEEGIERIRNSSTDFALVADSTEVKYAVMSHCDLVAVGEEFSRRPLGLAVQKGSPLKEQLSVEILKLQNSRVLEGFKDKWWNNNPYKMECDEDDSYTDGISIKNIGGVFIVICVGMIIAWVVLGLEFCWYQLCSRSKNMVQTISNKDPIKQNHEVLHKNLAIGTHPMINKRYYFAS